MAYESTETGRFEIYVRPFPGPGGKWQISTAGGEYPTWSPKGKELFYRTADQRIWSIAYTVEGDSFRGDKPTLWSEGAFSERGAQVRNFDLHPDGQRFAVLNFPEIHSAAKLDKVNFIFNFFDELRRIAPAAKR